MSYLRVVDPSKPPSEVPESPYTFPLDPFQQHAFHAIKKHENVLVTAKTGSGKTLVGEYQIHVSLAKGKRVFYTTPIKSLSNQKFHDLKKIWPGRVGIMTGDIKFQPDAPIVIMTTEILRNLLFKYKSTTKELGLTASLSIDNLDAVVFDEVHYINNRERGRVWEETLILLPPEVNLVLLSATIDGPERFASWLGNLKQKPIHLISTLYRIVPLTHAVVRGRTFFPIMTQKEVFEAQIYNSWLMGRKALEHEYKAHGRQVANRRAGGYDDPVVHGAKKPASFTHQLNELVEELHTRELLPALVFNFSRKGCETAAARLQHCLLTSSETASVRHIISFHLHHYPAVYESTKQYFTLLSLLERGIAFHHSGLIPLLKEIIEILFAKGLVKLLFATETFAVGINMPTKTVVFTGFHKFDDAVNGLRILQTDEYIQMAGRAGRRGKDTEGLVLYLPEREPLSVEEMKSMMTGGKATFTSRMQFHYDFILKTLHSNNTTWMRLMNESYWKQGQLLQIEGIKREIADTRKRQQALGITEAIRDSLERRIHLELEVKMKTNAAKKEAQKQLEQWKNTNLALDRYVKAYASYKEHEVSCDRNSELLEEMSNAEKSLDPLFQFLHEAGFLETSTNPGPEHLTPLGVLATEINEGHPLLLSKAYQSKLLDSLSAEEIVCVLASFLEEKESEIGLQTLKIPSSVLTTLYSLDDYAKEYLALEKKYGIQSPNEYWTLNTYWIEPLYRWIGGATAAELCSDYGLYEGNLIRSILKVATLAEELTSLARHTQHVELLQKLEGLQTLLVRDIVVPESLYLRI
jgi:superfamily II RNA helicase